MPNTLRPTRLLPWLPAATVCAAACVGGCASTSHTPDTAGFPAPHKGDGGVVIAQSVMMPGVGMAGNAGGDTSDCFGPALGVDVSGSTTGAKYVFDASGNPCAAATLMFDGRTMAGQRMADPTISLAFTDAMGGVPLREEGNRRARKAAPLAAIAIPEVLKSTASKAEDPLLQTLQNWKTTDAIIGARSEEADGAATRELTRMVRMVEENSSSGAASQLAAQLRERERQIAEERRRHRETLERSAKNRSQTSTARDAWQQEEARLNTELDAAKRRAAQFEELAGRLKMEQGRKEKAYQERIGTLGKSLVVAEQQADTNRRKLILEAAAKVAEAEALAKAVQIDTEQAQLAEAARLNAEANALMDKVLVSRGVGAASPEGVEPEAGPASAPEALALALKDVPVAVQVKERALPDIVNEVLQQAAGQAGAWRADWQLSPAAQPVLKEKWSLTAEATVGEIFADLTRQVKTLGFTLQFNMFNQKRVVVITDTATPAPAPAASAK